MFGNWTLSTGGPIFCEIQHFGAKKKPGARGNKPKALELANRALELARRAEDGNVEGRVLGVMELIKGALVIPHKVVPHS